MSIEEDSLNTWNKLFEKLYPEDQNFNRICDIAKEINEALREVVCPKCGKSYLDELNKDMIRKNRECVSCDHITEDLTETSNSDERDAEG
jgi:hypothetical protein